ncbi:zinc finger, CCHC-type containing protein [Tanacetum coccineum]
MGNALKYKARLVAKGFVQKKGVNFDEVFAPVARLDTVRLILALATQNGWVVHHLDVKPTFLNGDLEEEVYVTQLEGKDEGGVEVDPTEYKRVIGYVKGTLNYGLNYVEGQEVEHLVGFSDSDHAGDVVGARSTSGMIFYLGRNAITWQSQNQQIVSLSSCEFEFITAIAAACQAIWLTNLVKELTGRDVAPITLFIDNKSAVGLMKNPFHGRSVHLRKLDDRGKKMVYLGVEDETKGNRLYYPQDMKLRVNRDVVFDEKEGWNWSKDKKEERPMANTFTIIKPQP